MVPWWKRLLYWSICLIWIPAIAEALGSLLIYLGGRFSSEGLESFAKAYSKYIGASFGLGLVILPLTLLLVLLIKDSSGWAAKTLLVLGCSAGPFFYLGLSFLPSRSGRQVLSTPDRIGLFLATFGLCWVTVLAYAALFRRALAKARKSDPKVETGTA